MIKSNYDKIFFNYYLMLFAIKILLETLKNFQKNY